MARVLYDSPYRYGGMAKHIAELGLETPHREHNGGARYPSIRKLHGEVELGTDRSRQQLRPGDIEIQRQHGESA